MERDHSICILISTYDGYKALAEYTAGQIDCRWRNHPPIFFCGISREESTNKSQLALRRDSADRIGIATDAIQELLDCGFRMTYLVLDDHPPMGACQEKVLNFLLPQALTSLGATTISLFGTGQGRGIEGEHVVHQNLLLEHLISSHQWRYSLHPGLWSLKALYNVLVELDTILSELTERSPWAFERVGGTDTALEKSKEAANCYRIYSSGIVQPYKDYMMAGVLRTIGKLSRGFAGRVGGHKWWDKSSRRFDFVNHYYAGPYPVFWRGIMEKKFLNQEFIKFCRWTGKRDMSAEVLRITKPIIQRHADSRALIVSQPIRMDH